MSFDDLAQLIDLAQNAIGGPQERAAEYLAGQPPLGDASLFYWNAFNELGRDRPLSVNGQGLIPLTAIRAYARDLGMTADEYRSLKQVVCAVDNRRQALIDEKQRKQAKKGQ